MNVSRLLVQKKGSFSPNPSTDSEKESDAQYPKRLVLHVGDRSRGWGGGWALTVVIVQGQFVTVSMVASVAVYSSSSYVTTVALGHQVVKLSTTLVPIVVALAWTRMPFPVPVVFRAIDEGPTLAAPTRLQSESLIDSTAVEGVRL